GATDEHVAEELHLDLLETCAPTALALALAGIEAERAGIETALLRRIRLREEFPDVVERADVNRRVGTRCFAENGLVHEDDPLKRFTAGKNRRLRAIGVRWVGRAVAFALVPVVFVAALRCR